MMVGLCHCTKLQKMDLFQPLVLCKLEEQFCLPESKVVSACSETEFEAYSSYIASPNFPNLYPHHLDCACVVTTRNPAVQVNVTERVNRDGAIGKGVGGWRLGMGWFVLEMGILDWVWMVEGGMVCSRGYGARGRRKG
jgi:hypothetical protein